MTLGPALELVTLKGGLRRRRGSRSLNWSWSRWIWSVRMVHSVAASEHQRCAISPGRGAHTLLGEHFEGTGLMCASKTASEGALGLVHHRGPCTGQVDCGQQKGGGKGAALFSSLRPPHTVHWAWCITVGGAGACRLGGSSRECSKGSAGGLIRGGTCARRGFECISVAAQARWRSGQDGGTRRRCINLHCRGTRHLMKLT